MTSVRLRESDSGDTEIGLIKRRASAFQFGTDLRIPICRYLIERQDMDIRQDALFDLLDPILLAICRFPRTIDEFAHRDGGRELVI